jgi:indolepyruvate ferredoxin oxidoreductase
MVYDAAVEYPSDDNLLSRLDVRAKTLTAFDALAAAGTLFGTTAPANFLLVGAAYQSGGIPIPAAAIEEAIAINGVAVNANQAAFRWGRVAVDDPAAFRSATTAPADAQRSDTVVPTDLLTDCPVVGSARELLERRAAGLVAYQGNRLALKYIQFVEDVWSAERRVTERTELSEAVARGLHKLMAYKDEYEVARMLTDPAFIESVHRQVPDGENLTYKLHPPLLKALGRKKKISMRPGSHGALRMLAKGRFLRGTWLDPFGHTHMRRLERQLDAHYEAMMRGFLSNLTPEVYDAASAAASAPELVRGYEDVKMRNIRLYLERLAELGVDTSALPRRPHPKRRIGAGGEQQ